MLLAALAIHAAEPIIMTNTSLNLKLSLYPAESSKEGAIVFWTNKGEVERWSVTTASGKNYEMAVKSRDVVKQDGITKYMVKSSLDKGTFIKVFKNDLPVSVSFQIKGFANGQYATIDLPQDIKNHFASELANFNRPKQQPSTPADVIKFMGIPLWGDIETFAKQLEAKGWKFKRKDSPKREKHGLYNEVWHFENGRFWEFSRCDLWVHVLFNSRLVCSVTVYTTYSLESQVSELLGALKTTYGEFAKDYTAYNDRWERQIGKNHITVFKSTKRIGYTNFPALCITYANHLSNENEKIKKAYNDEVNRRYKIEAEQKRARANQDL